MWGGRGLYFCTDKEKGITWCIWSLTNINRICFGMTARAIHGQCPKNINSPLYLLWVIGRRWWGDYRVLNWWNNLTLKLCRIYTEQVYKGIFHIVSQIYPIPPPAMLSLMFQIKPRESPGTPSTNCGGMNLPEAKALQEETWLCSACLCWAVGVRSTSRRRKALLGPLFAGQSQAPLLSLESCLHTGAADIRPAVHASQRPQALPWLTFARWEHGYKTPVAIRSNLSRRASNLLFY